MSALKRLRAQFGKTDPNNTCFTNTNVWYRDAHALLDLAEAVQAWREAECAYGASVQSHDESGAPDHCVGDQHLEGCPAAAARQAVIAASQKLESL